jgi:hypothetical protein
MANSESSSPVAERIVSILQSNAPLTEEELVDVLSAALDEIDTLQEKVHTLGAHLKSRGNPGPEESAPAGL